jgi:hypothetical protein
MKIWRNGVELIVLLLAESKREEKGSDLHRLAEDFALSFGKQHE